MQLKPEHEALVKIAGRFNEALKQRDDASAPQRDRDLARGKVAAYAYALDVLREAGMPVASAQYLANPANTEDS